MQRGIVLIGVARTGGGLPELQAVGSALDDVEQWATKSQGIPDDRVRRISDETGRVTIQAVKDAVFELAALGSLEQLVVYFSGHGVNNAYQEYWLLSDAPGDAAAAVNVTGSATLAEYCGIPHVVLVSDACRTAAAGVVGQAVTGTAIFPNLGHEGPAAAVDVFYACMLGKPAHEVRPAGADVDPGYTAVYTDVLVEALEGSPPDLVQVDGDPSRGFVWPARLKKYLMDATTARLHDLGAPITTWQVPDARVAADGQWLSQLNLPLAVRPTSPTSPGAPTTAGLAPLVTVSESLLTSTLLAGKPGGEAIFGPSPEDGGLEVSSGDPARDLLLRGIQVGGRTPGKAHPDAGAAFVVHGRRVTAALAATGTATVVDGGQGVQVGFPGAAEGTHVLLSFADGTCTVLPAVHGFVADVLFDDDELADVAYEPTARSPRRGEYDAKAEQLRRLRGVISASSRLGVFRLDEDNAGEVAAQMQVSKGLDLSLALYATYAFEEIGRRKRLRTMREYLVNDTGVVWFDLEMLARANTPSRALVSPFVPALSQGWAFATAMGAGDSELLDRLQPLCLPSLWTLFGPEARPILEDAMTAKARP